jgi:hypothetical protein
MNKKQNQMKYLSDYMEDAQSELFERTNTIFAFSKKQFDEQKKEGVKYVNMGQGMITDAEYVVDVINGLDDILKDAMAQDLKENGKERVILRELANHEAYYTGEIDATYDELKKYDITEEEIMKMFRNKNAKLN